ncbi:competence protein CoiA [Ureibacillus sp. 179-F W5.1 NHS]|uniref:Competence protein CoiA n=1 Tax=Lysinibacillus halotolerans TaxID=1368476 RepID=A0A3M8HDS6_9BACI|nr:competence protein CoiA family protein [Lysinibacillus halotolerans]RND00614.1 hypothetical protein EC501_04000 [Lysinibacillus halotolerans]
MLVAYTEQNKRFVLNSSIPKTTLKQLRQMERFYCPQCKEPLLLKIGTFKIPHFAHYSKKECEHRFSERESEQHLLGKEQLYQLFHYLGLQVEIEPYLSELKQRPDLLIEKENRRFAIEFQCSPITLQRLKERNFGYKSNGIVPFWIPKTPNKSYQKGIQIISLNKQLQLFKMTVDRHSYIMEYNPIVRQFLYMTNLMHLYGNRFISKVQVIPRMKQQFPFYIPKQLTEQEFKQYFILFNRVKHNYLQSVLFVNKKGVHHLLLRSLYELRLNGQTLPNYIGIPIHGSEHLKVSPLEWQAALFYFLHVTKKSLAQINQTVILQFIKWAKLPETNFAISVVRDYCKILESLSIEHYRQSIHYEELFYQLYSHFLAIKTKY